MAQATKTFDLLFWSLLRHGEILLPQEEVCLSLVWRRSSRHREPKRKDEMG